MKRLILLLLGCLAAAQTAIADTAVYEGFIQAPNGTFAFYTENATPNGVYGGIVRAQQTVMNSLKSTIAPPLLAAVSSVPGYQQGSGFVSVSGPVTLTLSNGTARFSGLKVGASLVVQKSQNGVTANCLFQVSTNPEMAIVGTVDPAAGTLTLGPNAIQNFSLSTYYSCSTNIDWVPVVNLVVDAIINHYIDQAIAQQTAAAYNALANIGELQPMQFAGINQIPNGALLYNGIDYGAQLKSKLINLFYNTSVSVTIGDPKHYITGPKGYPHEAYSSDLILMFNIDGYSFQLSDKRTYIDDVYCPPNGRYCFFY